MVFFLAILFFSLWATSKRLFLIADHENIIKIFCNDRVWSLTGINDHQLNPVNVCRNRNSVKLIDERNENQQFLKSVIKKPSEFQTSVVSEYGDI
jgi:hypothetical protein